MAANDGDLLRRLRKTFKLEAQEHIQAIAMGLLKLEQEVSEEVYAATLDATFRAAHSLKGAARTVNVSDIESLCQPLESVFAALKCGETTVSAELFDLFHKVVNVLSQSLALIDTETTPNHKQGLADLIRSLQLVVNNRKPPQLSDLALKTPQITFASTPTTPPAQVSVEVQSASDRTSDTASDTIRVATNKLDAVLLQAEELLAAKLAAVEHATLLKQCRANTTEWHYRWANLRPELLKLRRSLTTNKDKLSGSVEQSSWLRVMEFIDWNEEFVESFEAEVMDLSKAADHDQRALGAMVDTLLDDMKKVVMQPFSTLLDALPRLVRELSREQGKNVELQVRGDDVEIDRRILEALKDPLIHWVRNCLDHGIETPGIRIRDGKAPRATLAINVSARNGSHIELLLEDDGQGIDADAVKSAVLKLGLLSSDKLHALTEQEALAFIFRSGVSTSSIITDLSGRGLGLAIVKENVEKLNGTLSVETARKRGTIFRITLPLTLARFRGVLVRVDEFSFVLPTRNVERVIRIASTDIKTIENREAIALEGQVISLARLHTVLGLHQAMEKPEPAMHPVVILNAGKQRIAFIVSEVLNEQEVLVKPLGKPLVRVRNVAGATVLGTGQVLPILNVTDLLQSAVQTSDAGARVNLAHDRSAKAKKQSVLVAEDSITSRILLKNILETAGYQVTTAVDGLDGFTKLRSGEFDLVVSDVEMPRLDGFGLTTKIRAEKNLTALPVILVTALESREDRERGIDVGANAYIAKGSFDQSNLLETVRRLI